MLSGIYTGCACVGLLIILILLLPTEKIKKDDVCSKKSCKTKRFVATLIQMKDYRQVLLVPISLYTGLQLGFFASDFTQVGKWQIPSLLLVKHAANYQKQNNIWSKLEPAKFCRYELETSMLIFFVIKETSILAISKILQKFYNCCFSVQLLVTRCYFVISCSKFLLRP